MFNYLAAHWKGELSFKRSFFINYLLINLFLNLLTQPVLSWLFEKKEEIILSYFFLNTQIAAACISCWQAVGVRRSLLKHYSPKDRTPLLLIGGYLPFISFILAVYSLTLLLSGEATLSLQKPVPTPPL